MLRGFLASVLLLALATLAAAQNQPAWKSPDAVTCPEQIAQLRKQVTGANCSQLKVEANSNCSTLCGVRGATCQLQCEDCKFYMKKLSDKQHECRIVDQ